MTQQDTPDIPDTLVHYYTNEDHIFRTITSYQEHELDTILDNISDENTWWGLRYSKEERHGYLRERRMTEERLYEEFVKKGGKVLMKHPAYMYIRGKEKLELDGQYAHCKYMKYSLSELKNSDSVSFTVNDSMWSFAFEFLKNGRSEFDPKEYYEELPLSGQVFHIKEFPAVYEESLKYQKQGFELQIWDRAIVDEIIRKNKDMK